MSTFAAPAGEPRRMPVRWLRVLTGGFGLAAVALAGGVGPLADTALLAGLAAALGTAWYPHSLAPWGVLLAALLPRLGGPGTVDAELLAQAAALLLFHACCGLLSLLSPAASVQWPVLGAALRRCGVILLAAAPAALLALYRPGVPGPVAVGGAAVAAAALVLLVRPAGRGHG